jgi:DNA-binding GntR family transcriptional regulator
MPVPTEAAPIDRRSARHSVLEQIRGWIEEGILEPGEVIKDAEIAEQLGVSRTPVREALQMLEQHGAVEMLPGRMTLVTKVTAQDVALLYAPLSALHGLAAEIATPRATPRDIEAMTECNERLCAAIDTHRAVDARDADRDFHEIILRLAANPYLLSALEPLQIHERRLETLYFKDDVPGRESYQEHMRIISAVRKGDARTAGELTRHNFTRFWTPKSSDSSTHLAS